ncbi:MAG: hypothetical protein WA840_04830 [Caulobacteraceae bacterium]
MTKNDQVDFEPDAEMIDLGEASEITEGPFGIETEDPVGSQP